MTLINWDNYKHTNLPIITVTHNNVSFKLLIDTGCESSLIDENIVELLLTTPTTPTMDGGVIFGNGEAAEVPNAYIIPLEIGDEKLQAVFHAMDLSKTLKEFKESYGIQIRGFLGSDFFSKYGFAIDYNNKNIYVVDGGNYQTKLDFEPQQLSEATE